MGAGPSDVLFVFPPAPGTTGAFRNHLGAAYLRAALARPGMTTSQYLNETPGTIDAVATDILQHKSPIVGFTVYDSNARLCLALAQSIKAKKPETKVVFGGPTATFSGQVLMERHPAIDLCVVGEAEETGRAIFSTLLGGGRLDEKQKGIVYRWDGQVVSTGWAPLTGTSRPGMPCDLDSTPSPYLTGLLRDGREGILTGRGCTHHCQYCCFAAMGRMQLRLHSIERVVAELECIARSQAETGERHPVAINDDAFTLAPQRAKRLCQAIASRKPKLLFSCITRADTLDEELIDLMWEAGIRGIAFGLESAVPSVLRAMGKVAPPNWENTDLTVEREYIAAVRANVAAAKKRGFHVGVSIILGFPTETAADGAETLRFVNELGANVYVHNFLQVFAGTPLAVMHERYGIHCAEDAAGLPETIEHAYDVKSLRPGPECTLREEAEYMRLLAAEATNGCSSMAGAGEGIATVVLKDKELRKETAQWLKRIVSVGGLVVQEYPEIERPTEKRLKTDREKFRDGMVPARYYVQVFAGPEDGEGRDWQVTTGSVNVYRRHEPSLLRYRTARTTEPMMAWGMGQGTTVDVCEIADAVKNPDKVRELTETMEREGFAEGPEKLMPPPQMRYAGRWLRGESPCLRMSRLEISATGEVRCCEQGEPIGETGDSLEEMRERLMRYTKGAEERRGCASCRQPDCPRCPFPGVEDREYCDFMRGTDGKRGKLLELWICSRMPLLLAKVRSN